MMHVQVAVIRAIAVMVEAACAVEQARAWQAREARARAARLAEGAASPVRRDGTVAPTPETERKRVVGAVARLVDERVTKGAPHGIDPACGRAALEIADVWERITWIARMRVAQYGERMPAGQGGDGPVWLIDAERRYARWRDQPLQRRAVGAGVTVHELVIAAAVEGMGLRQIAERYRMDQRTVERWLRESLDEYAVLAGWIVEDEAGA